MTSNSQGPQEVRSPVRIPLLVNDRGLTPPRWARIAFWSVLGWHLAIPVIGVVGAGVLAALDRALLWMLIPSLVYVATLATGFRLKVSVPGLLLELAVPIQVGLAGHLAGVSPAVILVELCLIEVGARGIGIGIGTARVREIPVLQIGLGLFLVAAPVMGLYPALLAGHAELQLVPSLILGTAFLTATWRQVAIYWRAAGAYRRTGRVQFVEVIRGTGGTDALGPLDGDVTTWIILIWLAVYLVVGPVAVVILRL